MSRPITLKSANSCTSTYYATLNKSRISHFCPLTLSRKTWRILVLWYVPWHYVYCPGLKYPWLEALSYWLSRNAPLILVRMWGKQPLLQYPNAMGLSSSSPWSCYRTKISYAHSLDPNHQPELINIISTLLRDRSPLSIGSVAVAFEVVCPTRLDLLHSHYRRLCRTLIDVDEWGQVDLLNLLIRYVRTMLPRPIISTTPVDEVQTELDADLKLLLTSSEPLLQSQNPAVSNPLVLSHSIVILTFCARSFSLLHEHCIILDHIRIRSKPSHISFSCSMDLPKLSASSWLILSCYRIRWPSVWFHRYATCYIDYSHSSAWLLIIHDFSYEQTTSVQSRGTKFDCCEQ